MIRVVRAAWILALAFQALSIARAVDNMWDYSVQAEVAVRTSPPAITLNWVQDTQSIPTSYTVSRKAPGATIWGPGKTLPGTILTYTDNDIAVGQTYEYRIEKVTKSYRGYGYVQSGIEVPLVDDRGTVVLVVEKSLAEALAMELDRLQQDLTGDGWAVVRHDVAQTDAVTKVKALIKADYDAAPTRVKSVFLFGHVPVPYSGKLNPDNHPDHMGAWPADVYYGDMHGTWTDTTVNYQQTMNVDPMDAARLSNVPGDGKFDQSTLPASVELEVGRVDLANLPGRRLHSSEATFESEEQMLRQYLNKDHAFRHGMMTAQRRAIVGDYFGLRGGESFSASGYRSFAPLVGTKNITNLNLAQANGSKERWMSALASRDYLMAYGCGPGTYATIDGLGQGGRYNEGTTVDLVENDVHAVFTLIFGSWLGDWDHEDNFMRSILAAPTCTLAAVWSGRPHWFVHPMGLGETIGYTARLSQTNTGLYQTQINIAAHQIHIALMGDPTLRLHTVVPGGAVGGSHTVAGTMLHWKPSADNVVGYHVYRAMPGAATFKRLTSAPVAQASFIDAGAMAGATYMVRAVKLETTPSGTYYNASQGVFWSTDDFAQADEPVAVHPAARYVASRTKVRTAEIASQLSRSEQSDTATP